MPRIEDHKLNLFDHVLVPFVARTGFVSSRFAVFPA